MAAPQRSLSTLDKQSQKIFWGGVPFSDQTTVAFSVVVINGKKKDAFTTASGQKKHAEIRFIERLKEILKGEMQKDNITINITINLSKSPCFTCREDLEDFFESLKNGGATITFTLRIANLYFGDDRNEDKNIEYLASWLCHLNRENIVHTLVIQPILVVKEILHYRPSITDVSKREWKRILKERRDKDTKIATITRIVTTVATIVNTVEQQRVIAQGPEDTRQLFTTLKEKLNASEKRTFYESDHELNDVDVYVAVAQVQINAVNTVGRKKQKVFKPIEAHDERECCHTIPRIITEIHEKNKKPQTWSIQSSTIVLAATHFPCNDCLARITSDLHEVRPLLILHVANFPDEELYTVYYLFERYRAGITVELHAIRVAEELGQVNCEHGASEEARQKWEDDKEQRAQLDEEVVKEVESITTALLEWKQLHDIH